MDEALARDFRIDLAYLAKLFNKHYLRNIDTRKKNILWN